MGDMILLHVGCGKRVHDGFINSDKDTMDISKPWPYADCSVDGIASSHVLQQLTWRDLVVALRESYRVLKNGGVMRFGVPVVDLQDRDLDFLLGWNNILLFSVDLLRRVLVDKVGFSSFEVRNYRDSTIPKLAEVDNRADRGTFYMEVIK